MLAVAIPAGVTDIIECKSSETYCYVALHINVPMSMILVQMVSQAFS